MGTQGEGSFLFNIILKFQCSEMSACGCPLHVAVPGCLQWMRPRHHSFLRLRTPLSRICLPLQFQCRDCKTENQPQNFEYGSKAEAIYSRGSRSVDTEDSLSGFQQTQENQSLHCCRLRPDSMWEVFRDSTIIIAIRKIFKIYLRRCFQLTCSLLTTQQCHWPTSLQWNIKKTRNTGPLV